MNVGESRAFNYTGNIQSMTIDTAGVYKLEMYGAQGGAGLSGGSQGGKGGYTKGYRKFDVGDILYIVVGGKGNDGTTSGSGTGGYNGGGNGDSSECAGGGGATHIALATGVLSSLSSNRDAIIGVAGAGGGAEQGYTGKYGGGLTGESGDNPAGTQTSGFAFGKGGNGSLGGGGGAGYYGGYGSSHAGSGGSSYIGGMPEFASKGIIYTPTTVGNQRTGNGAVIITFEAELGAPIFLGNTPVDAVYLGNTPVDAVALGNTPL